MAGIAISNNIDANRASSLPDLLNVAPSSAGAFASLYNMALASDSPPSSPNPETPNIANPTPAPCLPAVLGKPGKEREAQKDKPEAAPGAAVAAMIPMPVQLFTEIAPLVSPVDAGDSPSLPASAQGLQVGADVPAVAGNGSAVRGSSEMPGTKFAGFLSTVPTSGATAQDSSSPTQQRPDSANHAGEETGQAAVPDSAPQALRANPIPEDRRLPDSVRAADGNQGQPAGTTYDTTNATDPAIPSAQPEPAVGTFVIPSVLPSNAATREVAGPIIPAESASARQPSASQGQRPALDAPAVTLRPQVVDDAYPANPGRETVTADPAPPVNSTSETSEVSPSIAPSGSKTGLAVSWPTSAGSDVLTAQVPPRMAELARSSMASVPAIPHDPPPSRGSPAATFSSGNLVPTATTAPAPFVNSISGNHKHAESGGQDPSPTGLTPQNRSSAKESPSAAASDSEQQPGQKISTSHGPQIGAGQPAATETAVVVSTVPLAQAIPAEAMPLQQTPSQQTPGDSPARATGLPPSPAPALTAPSVGPVQVAQMLSKAAHSEMRIGLNTSAFGNVEVHTTVHANDVGLVIGSEKGDLHSLLAPDLPGITHTLQQQNLQLNQVNFQNGLAFDHNSSSGGNSQQQHRFVPTPAGDQHLAVDVSNNESTEPPAPASTTRRHAGLSILA
ncbi:MAG: hypothetical protein LAO24_03245 [Acidobacteriia bacterium]|nr:hypothetical protein [Terriglobia bacterium]